MDVCETFGLKTLSDPGPKVRVGPEPEPASVCDAALSGVTVVLPEAQGVAVSGGEPGPERLAGGGCGATGKANPA